MVLHFYYALSVCDLVANVQTYSACITATGQHRDFRFSLNNVLFSAL